MGLFCVCYFFPALALGICNHFTFLFVLNQPSERKKAKCSASILVSSVSLQLCKFLLGEWVACASPSSRVSLISIKDFSINSSI